MSPHGFADIHQHVLWGLDDGPATRKQMHALLRQNVENGVRLVYATAHAAPGLRRFNAELYRERLKEANAYCRKRDWPLRILHYQEETQCSLARTKEQAGRLSYIPSPSHAG